MHRLRGAYGDLLEVKLRGGITHLIGYRILSLIMYVDRFRYFDAYSGVA